MLFGMRFAAGAAASLVGLAGTALAQEAEVRETQVQDATIAEVQADEAERTTLGLQYRNVLIAEEVAQAANQALEVYGVEADAGSGLWLGVQLAQELPPALAHQLGEKKGALIETVYPDSPAAETGVEPYDLIVRLGDKAIESHQELVEAMQSVEEKPIDVVVLRGGEKKTISVTPRKREAGETTAVENKDVWLYTVPHVRVLPALEGADAMYFRQQWTTAAQEPGLLPKNVESLKVLYERDGDNVKPTYEIVTADGRMLKASTDEEIQALPEEIRNVLPQGLNTAKFAIRLNAAPPQVVTARAAPGFPVPTPPIAVPPAPQAGVVVAQPPMVVQPQQLVVPAWADVYRNLAPGAVPGAPPHAKILVDQVAQPSTQLDDLKTEMQKLNSALERIEKLLQKDE